MKTTNTIKIYHNNSCSKSCAALEVLEKQGIISEVINYLEDSPSKDQLEHILTLLKLKPQELIRKNEPLFKEKYEALSLADEEWLQILVENPTLIARPIIIKGDKAVIGRPIEKLFELLNSPT